MLDIHQPERSSNKKPQTRGELNLPSLGRLGELDFTDFHRGPVSRSRRAIQGWSLMAIVIDVLVSFVVSGIFVVAFSMASGMKISILSSVLGGLSAESFLAGCGVTLSFFYFLVLRAFFGFTVGEWACNLRMGTLQQRFEKFYILRVIARCGLVLGSGLVVIPLASFLLGQDLLEKITGLKITSI